MSHPFTNPTTDARPRTPILRHRPVHAPLRTAPARTASPAVLPVPRPVVLWDEVILGEVAPGLWVAPQASIAIRRRDAHRRSHSIH